MIHPSRPIGLTFIALFNFLGGVLGLIAGAVMILLRVTDTTIEAMMVLGSMVPLILGIGLWRKRNWARVACIILIPVSLLTELVSAVLIPSSFDFSRWHLTLAVTTGAIELWMMVYLLTPRVRRVFLSPSPD